MWVKIPQGYRHASIFVNPKLHTGSWVTCSHKLERPQGYDAVEYKKEKLISPLLVTQYSYSIRVRANTVGRDSRLTEK